MFCINLCEIFHPYLSKKQNFESFVNYVSSKQGKKVERIYLGSSFCSQYFLYIPDCKDVMEYCLEKKISVTITIPVFSEKDLNLGRRKLDEICSIGNGVIDEITVNDISTLFLIQTKNQYKINLGRLFFKDPRDCRVPEYFKTAVSPMLLSHLKDEFWRKFRFQLVELDTTNYIINTTNIVDTDIEIAVHKPYCYMSTGNICKFASVHRDVKEKFRPNIPCKMECLHITDLHMGYVKPTNCKTAIRRIGRTLYYEMDSAEFIGKKPNREIFFPMNEWRRFRNENISSFK